jgi:hypothetical protein
MAVGNPFRVTLELKSNRAALARALESRHRNDLRVELGAWHRRSLDGPLALGGRCGPSVWDCHFPGDCGYHLPLPGKKRGDAMSNTAVFMNKFFNDTATTEIYTVPPIAVMLAAKLVQGTLCQGVKI